MFVSGLLPASLGALGVGPWLSKYSYTRPRVASFLDGFIVVSIGGLVLLDILPHALAHRDVLAVVAMAAGFLLPGLAERMLRYGVRRTHSMVLLVALLGVAIHSMPDGSALAQAHYDSGSMLGYGVLLHQIPVGLMVCWVLQDRPLKLAWLVLLFMGLMTVVGYWVEPALLAVLPDRAGLAFEALVGGSLLHVLGHSGHEHEHGAEAKAGSHDSRENENREHSHNHDHNHQVPVRSAEPTSAMASGTGALLGLAVLAGLEFLNSPAHETGPGPGPGPGSGTGIGFGLATTGGNADVVLLLWHLILATAPALLLSYGAIAVFLATEQVRGKPLRFGDAVGSMGGVERDAGSFSLEATLVSVPLLGVPLAVLRLVMARLLMALEAGTPNGTHTNLQASETASQSEVRNQGRQGRQGTPAQMEDQWELAVATSLPWVLAGLVAAAMTGVVVGDSWLVHLMPGLDVVLLGAAAMLIQVHAAAAVPVATALIGAGVSPGAALALMLVAPLPSAFTIGSNYWLEGIQTVARRLLIAPAVAIIAGLAVNEITDRVKPWVWNGLKPQAILLPAVIAAVLLGLLALWVLIRRGVRDFLEPLRR